MAHMAAVPASDNPEMKGFQNAPVKLWSTPLLPAEWNYLISWGWSQGCQAVALKAAIVIALVALPQKFRCIKALPQAGSFEGLSIMKCATLKAWRSKWRHPRLAAQQCCAGGFRGEAGSGLPEVRFRGGAVAVMVPVVAVVMVPVAAVLWWY